MAGRRGRKAAKRQAKAARKSAKPRQKRTETRSVSGAPESYAFRAKAAKRAGKAAEAGEASRICPECGSANVVESAAGDRIVCQDCSCISFI